MDRGRHSYRGSAFPECEDRRCGSMYSQEGYCRQMSIYRPTVGLGLLILTAACGPEDQSPSEGLTGTSEQEVRGGTDAPAQPWLASIQLRSGGSWFHICAATLVRNQWMMTAAHCVDGSAFAREINNGNVRVCVGVRDFRQCPSSVRARVTGRRIHPNWNSSNFFNGFDVALLRLGRGFPNNTKVGLARSADDPSPGQDARLRGWGITSEGVVSPILQQLLYGTVGNGTCDRAWGLDVPNRILCANATRREGACNGDSGGPLHRDGRQVGIVSFGVAGCPGSRPDGYTRVSSVRNWVLNTSA